MDNLRGSLWMVAAMAAFAVEDMLFKLAAATVPVGQILMLFGAGGAGVFAFWAIWRDMALFSREVVSPPMLIRVCFEITGRLFYVLAIALIPLSAATVILQATPLVVVAGAAVIFGERVGWRRWAAIAIGMIGVVIVVQPGREGFNLLSLLAVVGMLGFAGRDLASRAAPVAISTAQLGFTGFLTVILAGAIYALWEGQGIVALGLRESAVLLGAVTAGVGAYAALMKAMRTGEVSAVTPFRYSRLLFGIALGVAIFGEEVTAAMALGAGLIVLSGLFILWRGRVPSGR